MNYFNKKNGRILVVSLTTSALLSCSTHIKDYQQSSPSFDIKAYFTGPVVAWGIVQDYSNQVTRRFCVEIQGSWQKNEGLLAETFYFDDGEISYRNWQLTKLPQGKYEGSAEDVVGIAKGEQTGFAFHWQYQLQVPIDGENYTFSMDDWMYQLDENRVFNRTAMKKFGLTVAQITLFFDKGALTTNCKIPPSSKTTADFSLKQSLELSD